MERQSSPSSSLQAEHVARADGDNDSVATTITAAPDHHREQVLSPPYWPGRQRTDSSWSTTTTDHDRPRPIRLEDNTEEFSEQSRALWARCVSVDAYTVVSGSAPGIGAYVVWHCTVETLKVRETNFCA